MTSVCDLIDVELAVDQLEAELAAELPAHVRAFARAYADGRPPPPAPAAMRRSAALATARNACGHGELLDRGLALLRLLAPAAIEDDPAVAAARAASPSWPAYVQLAAARDAASRSRFRLAAVELVHRLHGVPDDRAGVPLVEPVSGWYERGAVLRPADVDNAWAAIAARHGSRGAPRIEHSAARPRAFVVTPGAEVTVVVPEIVDTPAARFAVLHELGHAICALASPVAVPRVIDEAVASYVARWMEDPRAGAWHSELAIAARHRRRAIAAELDRVELAFGRGEQARPSGMEAASPPWSLWHDPGAQATYVAAEVIADRLEADLRASPLRLSTTIAAERARIDHATRW